MNNNFPLVTVITVCRNAAATLEQTFASIAAQTYPHIEYIVVDGGSTDNTVEMIRACPAVSRWLSESDKGISDAFNKGIAMASGEWIGIINADDWYEPDAIATVMNFADKADVIHGAVRYWDGTVPKEVFYPCQERLTWEMTVNHPSVFIRRDVYEKIGGFNLEYMLAMDYELLLRALTAGFRFLELKETVLANMRYGGASDNNWREGLKESRRAKDIHLHTTLRNSLYFLWQNLRGTARRGLEKAGLHRFIRLFRRYCSVLRKENRL